MIYVYGPFDKIRAAEPPLRFSWMEKTCSFSCKPTVKDLVPSVYLTKFLGFRFFNTCSYGEIFTGVSPRRPRVKPFKHCDNRRMRCSFIPAQKCLACYRNKIIAAIIASCQLLLVLLICGFAAAAFDFQNKMLFCDA